jgi:phosphate:Na+ symporter
LRDAVVHAALQAENTESIDVFLLIVGLLGGLAIFLLGMDRMTESLRLVAGGRLRGILLAHTIFNTINAFVVLPFVPLFAKLVERMVQNRPEDMEALVTAKYLDGELLRTPTLALDRARLELLRMADRVRVMLRDIMPRVLTKMKKQINSMERSAAVHEATRLVADAPDRIAHYRFEIDVIARSNASTTSPNESPGYRHRSPRRR